MPQQKSKSPHATTKTWSNQIEKVKYFLKYIFNEVGWIKAELTIALSPPPPKHKKWKPLTV